MAEWNCPQCTLTNTSNWMVCQACHTRRNDYDHDEDLHERKNSGRGYSRGAPSASSYDDGPDGPRGPRRRKNGRGEMKGPRGSMDDWHHSHRNGYPPHHQQRWGHSGADSPRSGALGAGDFAHGHGGGPEQFQRPPLEIERKTILEKFKAHADLKEGDVYGLIPYSWWESWCMYTGIDPHNITKKGKQQANKIPGQINNRPLIENVNGFQTLKKDLQLDKDIKMLPKEIYNDFDRWYGISGAFERKVAPFGVGANRVLRFDLHPTPLVFKIADEKTGDPTSQTHVKMSPENQTLQNFLDELAPKEVKARATGGAVEGRVWREIKHPSGARVWKELSEQDLKQPIMMFEFAPGTPLLLEYKTAQAEEGKEYTFPRKSKDWRKFEIDDFLDVKDTDGHWHPGKVLKIEPEKIFIHFVGQDVKFDEWFAHNSDRLASPNTWCDVAETSGAMDLEEDDTNPAQCGSVGLRNLGNTCFMNSTLQCLFNTPILQDYFIKEVYVKDINKKNPLGWGGKIADEYAKLLKQIWSGRYRSVAPRTFKKTIGEFQPRFSGYQQHDSSELLSFILDGLHEDLNLVIDKPPTLKVESNGRADGLVAHESWETHKRRNKSIVVDFLQGQLKSKLVCPTCKKDSTTFDPYTFLSVPLPHSNEKTVMITLLLYTETKPKPQRVEVIIPKKAYTLELMQAVIKNYATSLTPEQLVVAEVFQNKLFRRYEAKSEVKWSPSDNIWVYGLPVPLESKNMTEVKNVFIPVYNYLKIPDSDNITLSAFGSPAIVTLTPEQLESVSGEKLGKLIIQHAVLPFAPDARASNYEIVVMDNLKHLPLYTITESVVNLRDITKGHIFCFAVLWNDEGKESYEETKDGPVETKKRSHDNEHSTLNDCLDLLVQEEVLRESEAWFCSNCKDRKCATKKFDLWKLPQVLIIHLKRFDFNSGSREKLDTFIDFPLEGLDLSPWCRDPAQQSENSTYDLFAVSNHYGSTGGGHYTAFVRNLTNKQWYTFDDARVTLMDPNRCITSAAYVLFYVKQHGKS